jgi:DNA-binding transcriptional LysR family regulator
MFIAFSFRPSFLIELQYCSAGELVSREAGERKSKDRIGVIRKMNFAAVDLNLLRVFDAMMLEQSTVRAGERVGLSQPAVSSAIGRLRHITGDALFIRDGNRMVPTARALQLNEPVRAALRQLEEALSSVSGFDPAQSDQTFVILGSDYVSNLLMPRLATLVAPIAPAVTLQMLDFPSSEIAAQLSEGRVDVAVGPTQAVPDWIAQQRLFNSYIVCVARKDHELLSKHGIRPGSRIPPEVFCQIPQVFMSMDGSKTGTMDGALIERGLTRRVVMTVPHFQAVALSVAASRMLGNLPVHFARHAAPLLGLEIYLPPFDPPIMGVYLFWHKRHDQDPASLWLRARIEQAVEFAKGERCPHAGSDAAR